MKQFILLISILLSVQAFSQSNYEIGTMFVYGNIVKVKQGSISVTDSTLQINIDNSVNSYKIVKSSNNKFMLSDGIEDFIMTIVQQNGKMKGYEYSYTAHLEIKKTTIMYCLNKK